MVGENTTGREPEDSRPDAAKAVDFLEGIASEFPMALARIAPDRPGLDGATFTLPRDRAECESWIEAHNGTSNLYYTLNTPVPKSERLGKAGRLKEADVSHVRGVAVDLDPNKSCPLADERKRLFQLAERASENVFGPPTAVVDSGGGVQMVWLFDEPIKNSPDVAARVKAQARGLGQQFGSDPVHSLEHLFRLPWTQNLPNAAKRSAGRRQTSARLLDVSGERYSLDGLRHIAPPVAVLTKPATAQRVEMDFSAVLQVLGDPAALPTHLHECAENCLENLETIVGDAGDRSTRDYRVAAHVLNKHGVTDATELAQVTFSVSPERLSGDMEKGCGEDYCRRTVGKVLQRNTVNPHDWFEKVDPENLTQDEKLKEMFWPQKDDCFETLSIDEIFRLPDPVFAIDRHIPEAGMGFLYGAPGSGKSFVALDWALHMAYGLPNWHGDEIAKRPGAGVVYIAREGSSGFKARIRAWQRGRLLPRGVQPEFHLIRQSLSFMQEGDIKRLLRTVEKTVAGPIDMVVVDTVSRVMPGADENLQKEMTLFVKACDALQDALGCIVLGVHHSGKQGDMRGSSVLKGAGDFVFKLEKSQAADTVNLHCEKQKDAPDGWSEKYRLSQVEWSDGEGNHSSLVPKRMQVMERSEAEVRHARAVAEIVHSVLDGRGAAKWAEIREGVAAYSNRDGAIRPRKKATDMRDQLTDVLCGEGVVIEVLGGSASVWAEKEGPAATSAWVFRSRPVTDGESVDD